MNQRIENKDDKDENIYYELGQRVQKKRFEMGFDNAPAFYDFLFPHGKCKTDGSKQKFISLLENGHRWTIQRLSTVADKLGVTTDYLLHGNNKEYSLRDFARFICFTLPRAFYTDLQIDPYELADCVYGSSAKHSFSFNINVKMLLYPIYEEPICEESKETGKYRIDPRYAAFLHEMSSIWNITHTDTYWRSDGNGIEKEVKKSLLRISDALSKIDSHPYDIDDFDP